MYLISKATSTPITDWLPNGSKRSHNCGSTCHKVLCWLYSKTTYANQGPVIMRILATSWQKMYSTGTLKSWGECYHWPVSVPPHLPPSFSVGNRGQVPVQDCMSEWLQSTRLVRGNFCWFDEIFTDGCSCMANLRLSRESPNRLQAPAPLSLGVLCNSEWIPCVEEQ